MYKVAIVDGKEIGSDDGGFELMMRNLGYPLCVKFDEHAYEKPNVTKQDLVDHPDLFEPYRFIRSGAVWKYEECLEAFRYKNGKWVWDRAKSPDPNYVIGEEPGDSEIIAQDVAYMKQWHPELYKKVLELNELQEDDSGNLIPAVPQQNGKPHKPKPTAPGVKKSNTAGQTPVRLNKPDTQDPEPPVTETITGNISQMSDTSVLMGTKCKLASEPDGPKQTTTKSPIITAPTNDDVMQMAGTLSAAMKARMFTMSSRDEMTKFAEELAGVLQEECVSAGFIVAGEEVELVALIEMLLREGEPVGADGDVEINYTYISESLDFNNIAAAI